MDVVEDSEVIYGTSKKEIDYNTLQEVVQNIGEPNNPNSSINSEPKSQALPKSDTQPKKLKDNYCQS